MAGSHSLELEVGALLDQSRSDTWRLGRGQKSRDYLRRSRETKTKHVSRGKSTSWREEKACLSTWRMLWLDEKSATFLNDDVAVCDWRARAG
ncbi:hypothetical protein Sjap_008319 [Stephania japonica]|uniref:Uncharacterized protein n=1 Tax=Stephania japonica TaxID=461633 RepID=A0AAP0PEH6_9MAGN